MTAASRSSFRLHALAWLAGSLPPAAMRALARLRARLASRNGRDYQVARTNLALIAPHLGHVAADWVTPARIRAVLAGASLTALESLRVWTRPVSQNLQAIRDVHGMPLLQAALAERRGLLIAAPHYGNWELLNQWLAQHMPLAVLYAPPESATVEAFLNSVRGRPGVRTVRAEAAGVRTLLKHLQQGGAVGILPDQQPKRGDGVFAPFFGVPALTMTLFARLAQRSGATCLLVAAERRSDGSGFDIRIQPLPAAVADADPVAACTALNAAVETLVRADETQYQWSYKRFSVAPSGLGKDNPYWPHAYPNRRKR